MKKIIFSILVFSAIAIGALASEVQKIAPGDPKKDKQPETSFSFSKDYFNIFAIFDWDEMREDTAAIVRPVFVQPRKDSGAKPTN